MEDIKNNNLENKEIEMSEICKLGDYLFPYFSKYAVLFL